MEIIKGRRDMVAQCLIQNTMVVDSIPTQRKELLFSCIEACVDYL